MTLQIGQRYQTRSGGSVLIEKFDSEECLFWGDVYNSDGEKDRIASFTPGGQYVRGRETEFDIVAEA